MPLFVITLYRTGTKYIREMPDYTKIRTFLFGTAVNGLVSTIVSIAIIRLVKPKRFMAMRPVRYANIITITNALHS